MSKNLASTGKKAVCGIRAGGGGLGEGRRICFKFVIPSQFFTKLTALSCTIKVFFGGGGGGRVGDTFKTLSPYQQLLPLPAPVLRCFWKDPLMTPHHPTSSIFHCYPLPIHHASPYKNFDHTLPSLTRQIPWPRSLT